jgi:hypothetical protein
MANLSLPVLVLLVTPGDGGLVGYFERCLLPKAQGKSARTLTG